MIHLVSLNPALDLDLILENPRSGKIGHQQSASLQAGGKALNIARFLKKWKIDSTTWIGTGGGQEPTHILYRALLAAEDLKTRFLSAKSPIRINTVVTIDGLPRKYNHPGFKTQFTLRILDRQVKKGDLLVVTGRLPEGLNPSLYSSWIKAFNDKDVKTILDTSGEPLRRALDSNPGFLKVNLFEISEALRVRSLNLKKLPRLLPSLLKRGLTHGAVTHGNKGAFIWCGREAYSLSPSHKSVKRIVVGAGDAFLAGYLKGLQQGLSFAECARLACAAGEVVAAKGIQGFDPQLAQKWSSRVRLQRAS